MHTDVPLCIDLDGTLVNTDTLIETTGRLIKSNGFLVFLLPLWILRGKAYLKNIVASKTTLDVDTLPYNEKVLGLISQARQAGRKVVLCTGANEKIASAVAEHLDCFDEVIASTNQINMTQSNKKRSLVERFGESGYDFAGNDMKDFGAMRSARVALLVRPTARLLNQATKLVQTETIELKPKVSLLSYARQIRMHQWLKNGLIFLPVIAAHEFGNINTVIAIIIAFFSFSLCASGVYVFNDLMDLTADRKHPRKRHRPLASSVIPVTQGLLLIPLLIAASLSLATLLPPLFSVSLATYLAVTTIYNLWAKKVVVLDTLFLAGLYTLRILAGAAAASVIPSFWLLAFSMFLFLSIALAKRYTELIELELDEEESVPGRQYRQIDLSTIMSQGSASGFAAVLVFALYVNSPEVAAAYTHPELMWLICPLLLYWISKLWLNTQRREMTDDPLIWAIENRVSRAISVTVVLLLILAI